MGKASSGKKVARAASTGGGRTSRGKTPWGWYSAISLVVILGVGLVVTSRNETQKRVGARAEEHPTQQEHWHAAYGFYLCDQFLPPLADNQRDPLGIHTHGDGIVHVHPFSQAASGKRAVFDVFSRTMGITVNSERIELGDTKVSEGKDTCGEKKEPGVIQVFVNGEPYTGEPGDIHFEDRQAIVFAFAPAGAEIPKQPPSFAGLDNLTDVDPSAPAGTPNEATTSSTAPGGTPPPTEAPPTTGPPPESSTSSSTP